MAYILLTPDYFRGDCLIPELVDLSEPIGAMAKAIDSSSTTQIARAINQYQYDYLSKMFSADFAKAFLESKDASDLATGLEELFLEVHSRLYFSIESEKYSPIAYYVYYWYMRNSKTTSSAFGEVDIDFTYGKNVNNEIKLMDAWNRMSELSKPIFMWARSQRGLFKEQGYSIKPNPLLITKINRFGL